MDRLRQLIDEIHRRSLWQVAGIYLAGSWVAFQVVREITATLLLPEWFPPVALSLLVVGFPIVVATAVVQKGGPGAFESEPGLLDRAGREIRQEHRAPKETSAAERIFTWRNALVAGVLALAVWGIVAAGWVVLRGAPGEDEPVPAVPEARVGPTVAVLPFANLSTDAENEYFAAGIHEDILTHLSKVGELTVIARTSVLPYRDTDKAIREIAAELDAEAVLEGSVRRSGNRVRIVVQLIDPGTQGHLWAETYDRELDDVFAVQTEIARRVAGELEATLSPEVEQRLGAEPTESLEAYDLYLRGRNAYERYEDEANDESVRLYRAALDVDPDFALAWAGLADAFSRRVSRFGSPRMWADSAVRVSQRAVELDPDLAEAHNALGHARQAQRRYHAALDAYLEAVRLDPNHHGAVSNIGSIYQYLGRYDESIGWFRRSARLAPNAVDPPLTLAHSYTFLAMEDEAREWLERVRALDPGSVRARLLEAQLAVYGGDAVDALSRTEALVRDAPDDPLVRTGAAGVAYMTGEFAQAVTHARESLRLAPDSDLLYWHYTRTLLGLSLLRVGDRTEGRKVLAQAMEEDERRIEEGAVRPPRWDLAAAHAALGEEDAAVEWLERAYQAGFRHPRWPQIDPAFDGLRDDPRFRRIVADLEGDVAAMRERITRRERAESGSGGAATPGDPAGRS